MKQHIHLLLIDPQNDFCDLPADFLPNNEMKPALPVPGAHADMLRVAALIAQAGKQLAEITVTLDSHHRIDIAHPAFWQTAEGHAVPAFTSISSADVRAGLFQARMSSALPRVLNYLDSLEAAARYQLMVWPVHCELGSWGHNVHSAVRAAYNQWEEQTMRSVQKVIKGTNPWTEHYSAIMAEVPDPEDNATQTNHALIQNLAKADMVLIAGEAGSHCVRSTTEHIVQQLPTENIPRLVLLTDCISPVAGFDAQYQNFLSDMAQKGVRLAKSTEVLSELNKA